MNKQDHVGRNIVLIGVVWFLIIMGAVIFTACSSDASANQKHHGPPPTHVQVISGWTDVNTTSDQSPISIEVVKINGYCAILAFNGYKNTISVSYIENLDNNHQVALGCPGG